MYLPKTYSLATDRGRIRKKAANDRPTRGGVARLYSSDESDEKTQKVPDASLTEPNWICRLEDRRQRETNRLLAQVTTSDREKKLIGNKNGGNDRSLHLIRQWRLLTCA